MIAQYDETHAEDATDLYRLLDGLSGERGDWYMALVCAALNTADSLADALDLADEAMQSGVGEDDPEAFAEDAEPDRKFSSTQFDLKDAGYSRSNGSPVDRLRELALSVADEDLAEDGREEDFHVTAKYGLHTDDAADVIDAVAGFGSVPVTLGGITLFEGDEADVVKIEVMGERLHELNALLADSLPHTDKHPTYKPHLTLAYVKPGLGRKYVGPSGLEGQQLNFRHLVFSNRQRKQTLIDLERTPSQLKEFAEQPDEDTVKLALVYLAAELAKGTITEEEYDEAITNLLNGPEEFAEEDWTQQATKTGGVKWVNKTSGRVVYGKENPGKSKRKAKEEGGKPVEKATKEKPKAKGKEEDTATKEKKPAAKGKAAGPVGLEQARKLLDGATDLDTLAGTLAGLHNSDLQALKKELKVTAGGVKAEQAKAAARAALAAVKGAGPAKPEPTKPEPKAKLKPEPKKPEPGKGKVADEAQTWGSFLDAVGEREKAGGLLKIPELFDSLKKTSPDLTQEQFHDLLKKWQDEDKLVLQVANDPHFEPRAGEGIKDADGYTRLYVELGPKAEKELGQRKQSKPAVPAEPPPPPTPPPSPPAGGGEGPEKGGAPRALSFLKPPEGAPSAEAIQAHADAHKALARLKENKADSWSPYTPMLDRKIKQQQAALAEIQKKNPGLKSDEPGFSGIDALGRRWQDGKLVPREETRKAFDAIGQLQKTIVGRHKDHEVNRNPQVFDDLARQGLMKRSSIGGYELTSEGARALVEAYNDDPAGPTTHRGVQAYIAAYGSLPIEEKMAMAKHLGVPPNKSHPNMYPFFTDFEKSLRESTAERINEPIGPRLEKLKEQAAADIQALASMDRVKSAEVEKDVADVLRKRVKDPARVSVRNGTDVVPRSQKAMDRGASLLQGVIGRTSASLEGIESYQAVKPDGKLNMRAHAVREEKKINAPPGIDSPIAIHEIAHYLEDDPEILAASQAFLRHRTKGEQEVSLQELFPEYEYGPTEKGRKDNFDKVFGKRAGYYVGKAYGETSTEILSMGLEHLFRNPAEFAAKDPEYTAFLLGILDGSIRGKPIPKE